MKYQAILNLRSNQIIAELTGEQVAEVIRVGGGIHGIPDYKDAIVRLRGETNKAKQDEIKTNEIPAFIPSVYYPENSRETGATFTPKNWMVLDIDGKDNPGIAANNEVLRTILPASLFFISPKADGGMKLLIPVHFRNENDYPEAYAQITKNINSILVKRKHKELVFDKNAGKITQTCLFSWDRFAQYDNDFTEIKPSYCKLQKYATRAQNSALSEADWLSVDTTSVAGLFASTVSKMAANGIVWGKGTDAFLNEIYKLKIYGVGLAELLSLVHTHANGKYSRKHNTKIVTDKLTRLYNCYLNKFDKPLINPTNKIKFKSYLTEHLATIWTELQDKKVLYIDAPTGAGKTTLIKQLASLSGLKIDLLCPTTALANQQTGDGVINITGNGSLTVEHYSANVLAACYESIEKLRKRQAEILVIDEAHELASAYNYRGEKIQDIQRFAACYKYVVYLSGTMFPIVDNSNSSQVLAFERENKKIQPYDIVTLGKAEKDADYFASTLKNDVLNVFYKNDKTQLKTLQVYLESKGKRVLFVSGDNKLDDGYTGLIDKETLTEYDVLLTTCLLQSGVNVKDTRSVNIVFGVGCSVLDYIQFTARFRNVIPTIEIIHSGLIKAKTTFDNTVFTNHLTEIANTYNETSKHNTKLNMNNYSFIAPSQQDGIKYDNGEFKSDNYFTLNHRYRNLNNNCSNNIKELIDTLAPFGFVLNKHRQANTAELLDETNKRVKALSKDKRLQIAKSIIACTYTLSKQAGKDERDIYGRYLNLLKLEISSVTTDMLLGGKEYSRTVDRALWELLSRNKAGGFAMAPKAAAWFNKREQLQQQIQPGTYPADELKDIVVSIIGNSYDQIVNDVVGLFATVERKRETKGNRERYYEITALPMKQLTRLVGAAELTDDYFDSLFND